MRGLYQSPGPHSQTICILMVCSFNDSNFPFSFCPYMHLMILIIFSLKIFPYHYGRTSSCTHRLLSNMLVNLQTFWRSLCDHSSLPLYSPSLRKHSLQNSRPLECSLAAGLGQPVLAVSLVCLIYVPGDNKELPLL